MDFLALRLKRAAESILENESLAADLKDEAATVLLDWGVACAKEITYGTAGILDETRAEEAMYPRMRALRRMLRAINNWAAKASLTNREYGAEILTEIIEHASGVYGEAYIPPSESSRKQLLYRQNSILYAPASFIARLRLMIENQPPTP
jgi:hypothetical protein